MKAREFVRKIYELTPSKELLSDFGLSEGEIIDIQQYYKANEKTVKTENIDNALIDLVRNFDTSTLAVTLVTFNDYIKESEDTWRVGLVESDWLEVDRITNQVKVTQHDYEEYTIWWCADSGEKFLDALYEVAKYINSENKTPVKNCKQAEICAELAGGKNYLDFYKMLLSCDD